MTASVIGTVCCICTSPQDITVENGLEKVDCELNVDNKVRKLVSTLPGCVEPKLCAGEDSVCDTTKPVEPLEPT
eukprot:6175536-Pleurochrysis_carterae.AAC.1